MTKNGETPSDVYTQFYWVLKGISREISYNVDKIFSTYPGFGAGLKIERRFIVYCIILIWYGKLAFQVKFGMIIAYFPLNNSITNVIAKKKAM